MEFTYRKLFRISFHTKLQSLWLFSHFTLLFALLHPSFARLVFSLLWAVVVNVGSEAGAHRYFAHRSFSTSTLKKNILVFLQTFAGEGSVIAFCGVHRQHHAHADQELDPHSPVLRSPLSITYWLKTINVNMKHIRDCVSDPVVLFQHNHYFKFHILCAAVCIPLFGWVNYGYFFSLPIVLILYGNAATNILGHQARRGYRNFDTPDASVNIGGVVNFLLMGGGMQNNHHHAPNSYTTKVNAHERDSMGWIIDVFLRAPSPEVSLSESR